MADPLDSDTIAAGFDQVRAERFLRAHLPDACDPDCIYAVPTPADPAHHSADRRIQPERFRLRDVRARPAPAGAVIGWFTHLVHRGSRSRRFAAAPRLSITVYFQRRDTPAGHLATIEFGAALAFDARLALVGAWLGISEISAGAA
jgi:hypothetical protein